MPLQLIYSPNVAKSLLCLSNKIITAKNICISIKIFTEPGGLARSICKFISHQKGSSKKSFNGNCRDDAIFRLAFFINRQHELIYISVFAVYRNLALSFF